MRYTGNPSRSTDTQFLEQFYTFYQQTGRWPNLRDLDSNLFTASANAICGRFGGIQAAIDATKCYMNLLSDDEKAALEPERISLLQELWQRYQHVDYWIPRVKFKKDLGLAKIQSFARCCGGLDAALRTLDLPVCFPGCDDLTKALICSKRMLGITPRMVDADAKLCIYSTSTYLNEFLTWNRALIAAGLTVNLDQPNRCRTYARRQRPTYGQPGAFYPDQPRAFCPDRPGSFYPHDTENISTIPS